MRKLVYLSAIVLGSLSFNFASAKNVKVVLQEVMIVDEYTEIKLEEVPVSITEALKKSYPNAIVTKAYVNEKKEYKLDVKIGEHEGSLFADANGNWIQK